MMMKKSILVLFAALAVGAVHAQDTLKKIKDSGSVTMGVRESSGALAFTLGDGKYAGFHVDVCQHVLADVQKQLGLAKLDIKYQPVTSQNRIPLVQNGTVDIECGSTTNNATRQKDVAFAPRPTSRKCASPSKANSGITSIDQLAGKTVATTTGTTSVQLLRKHEQGDRRGLQGSLRQGPRRQLPAARIGPRRRLRDGRTDPRRATSQVARTRPTTESSARCCRSSRSRSCTRKDDPAFKKAVDGSIVAMIKSGEIAKLYDKWFMQPIPPSNTKVGLPASDATKAAWANPNDKPAEDYAKKLGSTLNRHDEHRGGRLEQQMGLAGLRAGRTPAAGGPTSTGCSRPGAGRCRCRPCGARRGAARSAR